jgi:hypothetical protein
MLNKSGLMIFYGLNVNFLQFGYGRCDIVNASSLIHILVLQLSLG